MYVPDNYDQYRIEENRVFGAKWTCANCEDDFTYDDMSDDLKYCEACYNELKEFENQEG